MKVLNFVKYKLGFLAAITSAALVGGLVSAAVLAAIPDSNGRINACYKNSTKTLSVTDPAGNCSGGSTALSWDSNSESSFGYATIIEDPSNPGTFIVDPAHSRGVIQAKQATCSNVSNPALFGCPNNEIFATCFDLTFLPKYFTNNDSSVHAADDPNVRDIISSYCGTGYDAIQLSSPYAMNFSFIK